MRNRIQRLTLLSLLSLLYIGGFSQNVQQPPFKKDPTFPALDLLSTDSTRFTKANVKKQNTLLMYFSPDCDHCIHQMEDMNKQMKDLENIQIIMVTHQPMPLLVEFIKKYDLKSHNNIKTAQDDKFRLPGYFAMKQLPFFALYDKSGNLITTFESNTPVDTLVHAFAKK